ncbi:MAG: hypothetical protein VKO64_11485 [Candidatus Sericytochromatia bacterium]|nr:hypothetical protein [Candidatus Sericytochromatia bacterium]
MNPSFLRRVRRLPAALGAVVALMGLVGCGRPATTSAVPRGPVAPMLQPSPQQPVPGQDGARMATEIRGRVGMAYQGATSIQASLKSYIHNVQTGKTARYVLDSWFQKPGRSAYKVRESTEASTIGTKMIVDGNGQVQVRTKFAGFWVNTTLPETDERTRTARGDGMSDTALPRMMQVLLDPQAQVQFLGQAQVAGRQVSILELRSAMMLPRVTHERYAIDMATGMPYSRECYEAGKLTYQLTIEQVRLNQPDPAAFLLQ